MEQKVNDFNVAVTNIITAHKWAYEKVNLSIYQNGRKYYGLVHILSGKIFYYFSDGRTLALKEGDYILFKPTDKYKFVCPSTCEHYTVNFEIPPSTIQGEIANKLFLKNDNLVIPQSDFSKAQKDTFEKLVTVWQNKEFGYRLESIMLTSKLLHAFIKKAFAFEHDNNYVKIKPAIELIENSWNKELSLKILADCCNLSVSRFRSLFSKIFGKSPIEYRNTLRLLYAKDYLMWEGYSIKQIGLMCGFEDVNYFCRFFKKHTGTSPSTYHTTKP